MAYFRKLGIRYEPHALIEVLTRQKPTTALPVVCHSLADMRAREAVPALKSLANFPVEDVKAALRAMWFLPWPTSNRSCSTIPKLVSSSSGSE